MRIGVFGGSFDPIHYGHLLLAEACREQAQLDRIEFVPTGISPHKQDIAPADGKHRLQMVALAIGGYPPFHVSDLEVTRGGISYSVDTLEQFAKDCPNDDLFFLMGADSLADFPSWRSPERILQLATLVVVDRPNAQLPDLSLIREIAREKTVHAIQVSMPLIELSSTDIRVRVREGKSIRFRTPRAVEKYIESHGLYKSN